MGHKQTWPLFIETSALTLKEQIPTWTSYVREAQRGDLQVDAKATLLGRQIDCFVHHPVRIELALWLASSENGNSSISRGALIATWELAACPVCLPKRTRVSLAAKSALGQNLRRLFNHVIGLGEQRRRHGKAQCLGGPEVDC